MDIADNSMSFVTVDPLDAFADDCGAQMTDVERLCNVGTAVIDNDGFFLFGRLYAKLLRCSHLFQIFADKTVLYFQVQKSGRNRRYFRKYCAVRQLFRYVVGDHDRGFMVFFCARHRAVTLIFAQIGTVGHGYASQLCLITCSFKAFSHLFGNELQKFLHVRSPIYLL